MAIPSFASSKDSNLIVDMIVDVDKFIRQQNQENCIPPPPPPPGQTIPRFRIDSNRYLNSSPLMMNHKEFKSPKHLNRSIETDI